MYWPLIEMIRSECGIAEGDDPATVRERLNERLLPLLSEHEEADQAERRIAPIARLLGAADSSREPLADQQEQQDARESFFGAVRVVMEALAADGALVLAWEDIHWADEGTLDLIDYLSRWLRAPVLQVCLARDELLGRRPGWSTMRRTATVTFLEPLAAGGRPGADPRAAAGLGRDQRAGERARRALRRQPPVRRGDGAADRRGGRPHARPSCPTPCRACWRPAWTRWSRSSASWSRTRRCSAGPSGRAPWSRWRRPPAVSSAPRWRRCARRTSCSRARTPRRRAASASWPSSTC